MEALILVLGGLALYSAIRGGKKTVNQVNLAKDIWNGERDAGDEDVRREEFENLGGLMYFLIAILAVILLGAIL